MSAVRREQPIRLPSGVPGMPGALLAEADAEELRHCLTQDHEWLNKFLADAAQNPAGVETAAEYVRSPDVTEHNRRVVQRTMDRIEAVEEELARREEEAYAKTERERADARAWLRGFLSGAAQISARYHERAAEVAAAWALVEPIARAVGLLTQSYQSTDSCLPVQHSRLMDSVRRAADALGATAPELTELDPLPTHDEVMRAVRVIRGHAFVQSEPPLDGLGSVRFESLLTRAKG
jgi:hypothetical protein